MKGTDKKEGRKQTENLQDMKKQKKRNRKFSGGLQE